MRRNDIRLPPPLPLPRSPPLVQPFISDEEVEKRYKEISQRSGILNIGGREYKCQRSDIEELADLGHGAFGAVRRARCKLTGTLMAVKIIPLTNNADGNKRTVMDMDVVMRSHNCPHIVRCYGCFVFESEVRICMEIMTMCLDKLLKKAKRFPEIIVGKITNSVFLALKYLKDSERIMHRDVKPSNILIDMRGNIKVCDFGISGRLIDSNRAATHTKGSIAYLAPERVGSTDDYGVKADVWSIGIMLIELATGSHPYDGCKSDFEILSRISNDAPPRINPSDGFSDSFCDFVNKCLSSSPETRPSYRELLEHPFILFCTQNQTVNIASWFLEVMQRQ